MRVGEPSVEDAVLILRGLQPAYEEHHGVALHRRRAARRRRAQRPLPHRARAARQGDRPHRPGRRAAAPAARRASRTCRALIERLADLEADKNAAVGAEHYEEASRIRDQIADVQARARRGDLAPVGRLRAGSATPSSTRPRSPR